MALVVARPPERAGNQTTGGVVPLAGAGGYVSARLRPN